MENRLTKSQLYRNISELIEQARQKTAVAINTIMVRTYWNIGRLIVEEEQKGETRAAYGNQVLKILSDELTKEFGKGFHVRNLRYMRSFYLTYPKWNAVRSELTWTHYRLLLRVDNERARNFYEREAVEEHWSTRQLDRQINTLYYERLLASKDKTPVIAETGSDEKSAQPEEVIKDPYVLEFLDLGSRESYTEKELESALIEKLQEFLLELGKGFSFVGRQKRITTESGKHFYIDLVFYNFFLKCFVLIDLKVGELTHQDIGQIDMYVRLYEEKWRKADDNPSIGIILCSEKDHTIVKYSVLEENRKLFASKYKLYLPSEEELSRELNREMQEIKMIQRLEDKSEK